VEFHFFLFFLLANCNRWYGMTEYIPTPSSFISAPALVTAEQRQTITALTKELTSVTTLLNLQINETKNCEQHISILNHEIDTLRCIVTAKEESIFNMTMIVKDAKEKVIEIEKEKEEIHINKAVLYELEQQNKQLLERIKELQSIIEEQKIENNFLQNHKNDRFLIEENQLLKLQELVIKSPYEQQQLIAKLINTETMVENQKQLIEKLEKQCSSYHQLMIWKEEIKNDQLSRSKLNEYHILIELDLKEKEMNQLEIEKTLIFNSQQITLQTSQELTKQLVSSQQEIENLNSLYSTVIHTLEKENSLAIYKEKLLSKENYLLQMEKQLFQQIVSKISSSSSPAGAASRPVTTTTTLHSASPASAKHNKSATVSSLKATTTATSSYHSRSQHLKGSLQSSGLVRPVTTSSLHALQDSNNEKDLLSSLAGSTFDFNTLLMNNLSFHQIKNNFLNKYLLLFIEYLSYCQQKKRFDEIGYLPSSSSSSSSPLNKESRSMLKNLLFNNCGIITDDLNMVSHQFC
jgi:hypothetical protein